MTAKFKVVQDREQAKAQRPSWYAVCVEGARVLTTEFFWSKDAAMRGAVRAWPFRFPAEVR